MLGIRDMACQSRHRRFQIFRCSQMLGTDNGRHGTYEFGKCTFKDGFDVLGQSLIR